MPGLVCTIVELNVCQQLSLQTEERALTDLKGQEMCLDTIPSMLLELLH